MEEKDTVLAHPPKLVELGLPPEVLTQIQTYVANPLWEGLSIMAGDGGPAHTALFYAVLQEFTSLAVRIFIVDQKCPFSLSQPPRVYKPLPANHTHTEDELHTQLVDETVLIHKTITSEESYADTLLEFSRWDPDLIALGDIPDTKTLEVAVSLCQTGHRVLAKMKASSVDDALEGLQALQVGQIPSVLGPLVLCVNGDTYESRVTTH